MSGNVEGFRRLFPKNRIPIILSSIIQASESLRKKTELDREDWITRRLCSRLTRVYPFRDGPFCISLQSEILNQDMDSDFAGGRIDLLVVPSEFGSQAYFAIEAKKLRFLSPNGKLKTGIPEYVNDGMTRFVEAQYSPLMETGAMIGYVFDGLIEKSRSGIAKYIRRNSVKLGLRLTGNFEPSKILPGQPVDETNHDLTERTFTIYHLFIAV